LQPRLEAVWIAISGKARNVRVRVSAQDNRNRWHETGRETTPAKDEMDQGPPNSTVAVGEGIDRLELRMGHGGLGDGREVGPIEECDEIEQQARDFLGRRRDVDGIDGIRLPTSDPVLLVSDDAGTFRIVVGHEDTVYFDQITDAERSLLRTQCDRAFERSNVGCNGARRASGRARVNEGAREVRVSNGEPLNLRRTDRFRAKEKWGYRFDAGE
jgi:hypothetical protein